MIEIPKQLQKKEFGFVLLKINDKIPFEKNWQKNPHRFDGEILKKHLLGNKNYGCIGGYGNLRILDIDNKELGEAMEKKLNTFTIRTGGGGRHFYFISDYDKNHVLINELGELRAKDYQVVGSSCKHPNGNTYDIINDVPIETISKDLIVNLIKPYLREERGGVIPNTQEGDTTRSALEYRKIIALLREGKERKEIYKMMAAYSKWQGSPEQYKALTFEKAELFVLTEKENKTEGPQKRTFSNKEMKSVYNKIINVLKKYMDLNDEYYSLIALWIIGTYAHKKFPAYPYLFINAMKGSGKTRLLKIITALSCNGKLTGSMTEAVMFRKASERTLCMDEFESVSFKEKTELRLLLNSAYKKGVVVERMSKKRSEKGESYEIEEFEVYCPIAIANIWGMENVLADRCITIIIEKSQKTMITKLIEDFEDNIDFIEIKQTLSSIEFGDFNDIYKTWNEYQQSSVTSGSSGVSVYNGASVKGNKKHASDSSDSSDTKNIQVQNMNILINETNLQGRDLELFFPLYIVAHIVSPVTLSVTLEISKKIVNSRKESDIDENKDVQLIDFVSQFTDTNYVSVTAFTTYFKDYLEIDDKWINSTWMGKALRRVGLVRDKRRLGKTRQVQLNIAKAQENIKMFRVVDEDDIKISTKVIINKNDIDIQTTQTTKDSIDSNKRTPIKTSGSSGSSSSSSNHEKVSKVSKPNKKPTQSFSYKPDNIDEETYNKLAAFEDDDDRVMKGKPRRKDYKK